MKKNSLLFILIIHSLASFSQSNSWNWALSIDNETRYEIQKSTIDSDGNAVFVGTCCRYSKLYVTKISKYGNILWEKKIAAEESFSLNGISIDKNNNIHILGSFSKRLISDAGTLMSIYGQNMTLLKLNTNGTVLWQKILGVGSGMDIRSDNKGNYYISGDFSVKGNFGSQSLTPKGNVDALVAKIDSTGNVIWVNTMQTVDADYGWFVDSDSDGNCYLSGISNKKTYLTKYDANGNLIWDKRLITSHDVSWRVGGLNISSNGEILLSGTFGDYDTIFNNSPIPILSTNGIYLAKLDSSGSTIWCKTFGNNAPLIIKDQSLDENDITYLVGYFSGTIKFGKDNLKARGTTQDVFITAIDKNGSINNSTRLGNEALEFAYSISADKSNNSIFISGNYNGETLIGDIVLRAPPAYTGNPLFVANLVKDFENNTNSINFSTHRQTYIYPNPSITGSFNYVLDELFLGNELVVKDLMGRLILNQPILQATSEFSLPKGNNIYFLSITDKNGILLHTQKLLVH